MNATLEHIWHEFAEKLGQFIRARVNDPASAEDILQDVFVKIQARLDQLKDPAKLQSWIYLIARNAIIDHYRTRKATVEVPETLAGETEDRNGETDELKAAFRRMIYNLPDPYREALVLTEFDGLTQQQLADSYLPMVPGCQHHLRRHQRVLCHCASDDGGCRRLPGRHHEFVRLSDEPCGSIDSRISGYRSLRGNKGSRRAGPDISD